MRDVVVRRRPRAHRQGDPAARDGAAPPRLWYAAKRADGGFACCGGCQAHAAPQRVSGEGELLPHTGRLRPFPPFFSVDIHNHGLGGTAEVLDAWSQPGSPRRPNLASAGAAAATAAAHRPAPLATPAYTLERLPQQGTTTTLASLIPADADRLEACVKAIRSAMDSPGQAAARVVGIHAEGPIIADLGEKRRLSPTAEMYLPLPSRRLLLSRF